ncbi:hypothetical protein SKAU_G00019890 [Synaphobranchus kaupii]|uniref:Uncharacterized protein n=1 Tax=Synaphobranchus kaupii TaxID=118154 RepID=A0A9Q1GBL2_SYNKA|nr:hypothetical protein SKAU_G00019890 [Synaphobranchus kaupii]
MRNSPIMQCDGASGNQDAPSDSQGMVCFKKVNLKVYKRGLDGRMRVYQLSSAATLSATEQNHTLSTSPSPLLPPPPSAEPAAPEATIYAKLKKREAWEALQEEMMRVSRSLDAPISSRCTTCHVEEEMVAYRCCDFGPCVVLCDSCVTETHQNSLHLPEQWKDFHYQTWPGSSHFNLEHHVPLLYRC